VLLSRLSLDIGQSQAAYVGLGPGATAISVPSRRPWHSAGDRGTHPRGPCSGTAGRARTAMAQRRMPWTARSG